MVIKSSRFYAQKITSKLQQAGYIAYFAGGWVRDYLLGHPSSDIDIATSAHPEEVMRLFPRSIAVGVQFGVVRVRLHGHEFEVATFRSDDQYVDGRRPACISLHSSPEEDAKRRDFTINGMFYDPVHHAVYDYVGGKKDLENTILRTIGSPYERFKEDRLRIIRAIRFKNVFHFSMEKNTWNAICEECHHVVPSVSPERIWQELDKMVQKGVFHECLEDMKASELLFQLFPCLKNISPEQLSKAFDRLRSYRKKSLAAALCLITPPEARDAIADQYKLSTTERMVFKTYARLEAILPQRPRDDVVVRLFSMPEADTAFEAFVATRKSPQAYFYRYKKRLTQLQFWLRQAKTGKYLLGGDDCKKLGIPPGKEMGALIKHAFAISSLLHIRNKERLIAYLRQEGKL